MPKNLFVDVVSAAWVDLDVSIGLNIPVNEKSAFDGHFIFGRTVTDRNEGEGIIGWAKVLKVFCFRFFHDEGKQTQRVMNELSIC